MGTALRLLLTLSGHSRPNELVRWTSEPEIFGMLVAHRLARQQSVGRSFLAKLSRSRGPYRADGRGSPRRRSVCWRRRDPSRAGEERRLPGENGSRKRRSSRRGLGNASRAAFPSNGRPLRRTVPLRISPAAVRRAGGEACGRPGHRSRTSGRGRRTKPR